MDPAQTAHAPENAAGQTAETPPPPPDHTTPPRNVPSIAATPPLKGSGQFLT